MRRVVLFSVWVLVALVVAAPASAHRSPADCNANRLDVALIRDKNLVKNGDTINYTVEVSNMGSRACDVSNITVKLQLPGPDGTPSGPVRTVVDTASYLAQTPVATFGPFPYVVNANPGVGRLEARVSVENGVLHDNEVHSAVNINRTIGSTNPTPGIEVDKSADIRSGLAPQRVTYTFRVYNRTSPPATLDNVTLTDNKCPGAGTQARPVPGDVNQDNRLQPAEVWEFTCVMDHGVGVFVNTAEACAELILDSGEKLPKVCDTDDETVEFTPVATPTPTPPTEAVKSANATQSPCTLATPKGLTVRKGEVTSIRATVRNVDAGSSVKITLPGGKTVSAKTNSKGIAILKVKPTKTGTARITVAECSDVERLTVRAARQVQSRRIPRVTG